MLTLIVATAFAAAPGPALQLQIGPGVSSIGASLHAGLEVDVPAGEHLVFGVGATGEAMQWSFDLLDGGAEWGLITVEALGMWGVHRESAIWLVGGGVGASLFNTWSPELSLRVIRRIPIDGPMITMGGLVAWWTPVEGGITRTARLQHVGGLRLVLGVGATPVKRRGE